MRPGFAELVKTQFLPSVVDFVHPTYSLRYQLISGGSKVAKLCCISVFTGTEYFCAILTSESESVTRYDVRLPGRGPLAMGWAGLLSIGITSSFCEVVAGQSPAPFATSAGNYEFQSANHR